MKTYILSLYYKELLVPADYVEHKIHCGQNAAVFNVKGSTFTRVLEIVYNSCRYLGITDIVWQLATTMPTNCAVWSMPAIILFLSSHQKFKQARSLWHSVLKSYFLQKTLPLGFIELTTTLLLSNILQYSYYVIPLSSKINWETTENHTFSSFLCQQCLWNACYL